MARVLDVNKNVEEIMGFPQGFWRISFPHLRCPLVENSVDNVQKLAILGLNSGFFNKTELFAVEFTCW